MPKLSATLALAAGSLLFCATSLIVDAAASPYWQGQSGSGNPSNCTDANGKPKSSKECDKLSPQRLSTGAAPTSSAAQSSTASGARTSTTTSSAASRTAQTSHADKTASSKASVSGEAAKKDTKSKKDADSLSDERMSTRGLKPPPKDADKDKNKSDPKSDASNPK